MAAVPSLSSGLQRNNAENIRAGLPLLSITLPPLIDEHLKSAYRSTTGGKFNDALTSFQHILYSIPFLVVESKREMNEVRGHVIE